jgi:prephenate dehydratase
MNLYVLGPEGTNSHEAATRLSTSLENNEIVFCERNIDALRSASRENGYAVVPIENSSAGLVNDVVKGFWMVPGSDALHVVGETRLPIEHHLLVRPDVDEVASIRTVASHPQALAQCGAYLSEQRWIRIPSSSTALSARLVSEDPAMRDTAAIASRFAAERYGLRILREHIEDAEGNATRFHLVGPNGTHPTGHDRTPVVFRLPDEAGALLRVLQIIAGVGVNMSSLHSIPMGTTGEFAFYCELDCHRDDERGRPIVEGIRTFVPSLRVLGSYSI